MVLWDLFCGAGGAAEGFRRGGFERIVGVDIAPQPRYPFEFVQADVIDWVRERLRAGERPDAAHASPPCQAYSDLRHRTGRSYVELVAPTRVLLRRLGVPYVIENVEGAPLLAPVLLCGTMFEGLRVLRHRLFETNWPLLVPPHPPRHPLVFTHDKRKAHYGRLDQATAFVQVTGGGNCTLANARSAMGIDWMTKDELNEAVPPAYTEHIGRQLIARVG
jgi:DNA (cytosine-5)-methyltransferase 1